MPDNAIMKMKTGTMKLMSYFSANEKYKAAEDSPRINLVAPAFILISWLLTSLVLTFYSELLAGLIGKPDPGREFLICGGQIIFQGTLLLALKRKLPLIINYLATMMAISFAGAVLLLPVLAVSKFIPAQNPLIYVVAFLLVAGCMFLQHLRLMKLKCFPKWLSASWVLYRLLVLAVLLLFVKPA
jgi:hypothetical protein